MALFPVEWWIYNEIMKSKTLEIKLLVWNKTGWKIMYFYVQNE